MRLIAKTLRDAMHTPGFTLLYIIGVAFTIAFTMVYGMILYAQLGPVYPEYNRNSTVYLDAASVKSDRYMLKSGLSKTFVDEYLHDKLKSAENITAMIRYKSGNMTVQTDGHGPDFKAEIDQTDPDFFKLYEYEFLAGSPFSQSDFDSRLKVAVISDKLAGVLFDSPEEAVGNDICIDYIKYRITGVVKEGSALCVDSFGEVFIPYSLDYRKYDDKWPENLTGPLTVMIKVKPGMENVLKDEIRDICRRINAIDSTAPRFCISELHTHEEHVLSESSIGGIDEDGRIQESRSFFEIFGPILIGLFVVLVIPALNISGLIGACMDRMASEIGIRRSFGATRKRLMRMVITENLVLTLAGGVLGLVSAWIIVALSGKILLQFSPMEYINAPAWGGSTSFATGEIVFSPAIFLLTLIICILLNTISAWIPARRAMRRQVADLINVKR